jgi:hypothetical protein
MTTIGGRYFLLLGRDLLGVFGAGLFGAGVFGAGVDPPVLTLAGVVAPGPRPGAEGLGAGVVEVVVRGATLTLATLLRALLSAPT